MSEASEISKRVRSARLRLRQVGGQVETIYALYSSQGLDIERAKAWSEWCEIAGGEFELLQADIEAIAIELMAQDAPSAIKIELAEVLEVLEQMRATLVFAENSLSRFSSASS